jgi:hypothetical protein
MSAGPPTERQEPTAVGGPDDPRHTGIAEINRVAEVQFHLRPQLGLLLRATALTTEARDFLGIDAANYEQYWQQTFGDRFFDMGTLQRLATATETGLRHHYRSLAGEDRARHVARTNQGVFQQLVRPNRLLALYENDCGYDLTGNPGWARARELMAHRHLYAHRSGLVDDRYLRDIRDLTGVDLLARVSALGYPDEDVFWFTPLQQLGQFIEDLRLFFRHLPLR